MTTVRVSSAGGNLPQMPVPAAEFAQADSGARSGKHPPFPSGEPVSDDLSGLRVGSEEETPAVLADGVRSAAVEALTVSWWHRLWVHRWTMWGETFSSTNGGLMAAFSGGMAGPWWQERTCTVCGRSDRRRVELSGDRR